MKRGNLTDDQWVWTWTKPDEEVQKLLILSGCRLLEPLVCVCVCVCMQWCVSIRVCFRGEGLCETDTLLISLLSATGEQRAGHMVIL